MRTKKLGKNGPALTCLGLGTWAIGGPEWKLGWGAQDDNDSIAVIHEALDLGINWIDTAAVYGLGHSEEVVGKAIAGRRDTVFLATKCGRVAASDGYSVMGRLTAQSVRDELDASLRRLKTDWIDLYQIHWPDPEPQIEEGWTVIADAVKQGKIRWAGVSNFNVSQLERIQRIHPVTSLQPPYSLLARGIEDAILPFCAAHGIGVICYSPMQKGLLSGAFTRERAASLPDDDQRSRDARFKEPELSKNLEFVERLRPVAARHGVSVGEVAIAWVLRRPEVTAAIVGGRRPGQSQGLAGAAEVVLSQRDLEEIAVALKETGAGA
jgi:aryl-alcohol dehydrogenase-like predicted oxidoreductase